MAEQFESQLQKLSQGVDFEHQTFSISSPEEIFWVVLVFTYLLFKSGCEHKCYIKFNKLIFYLIFVAGTWEIHNCSLFQSCNLPERGSLIDALRMNKS
jgi:hypothetical protein